MHGKFITLEGGEGAGKSTAMQFLQQYLNQRNIPFICTREPGGTKIAEEIRRILLFSPHDDEKIYALTELLLMFASRNQLINEVILPNLKAGVWVVSDRYIDATYAYQGGGRKISLEAIKALDKIIVNEVYPDLTLLLDIPAEKGLKRTDNRSQKDRIEKEQIEFFERIRESYLQRAKDSPNRIKIIDADQNFDQVNIQIKTELENFIKRQLS